MSVMLGTSALLVVLYLLQQSFLWAPDVGKAGGPIEGLTPSQLKQFYDCRAMFERQFSVEEGLGPLFNARSCNACHSPSATPENSSITVVAGRSKKAIEEDKSIKLLLTHATTSDINELRTQGGPVLVVKSITQAFPGRFPPGCNVLPATRPAGAEFISRRVASPLYGLGFVNAVGEEAWEELELDASEEKPEFEGRSIDYRDSLTRQTLFGRFGWKAQWPSLLHSAAAEMNTNLGITSPISPIPKSADGSGDFPDCILRYLPLEPNDNGSVVAKLVYYVSLLAPPKPVPLTTQAQRGKVIFDQLNCSTCHRPETKTAPVVYVVDPESPAPKFQYIEVAALENKTFSAYSDFLLHPMGEKLADGLATDGTTGGEWRTPPLWGLSKKKYFLHDGRTTDLSEAIMAHGGQAEPCSTDFEKLPAASREDLLAFLRSL